MSMEGLIGRRQPAEVMTAVGRVDAALHDVPDPRTASVYDGAWDVLTWALGSTGTPPDTAALEERLVIETRAAFVRSGGAGARAVALGRRQALAWLLLLDQEHQW
jgi:hypothetical protein